MPFHSTDSKGKKEWDPTKHHHTSQYSFPIPYTEPDRVRLGGCFHSQVVCLPEESHPFQTPILTRLDVQ